MLILLLVVDLVDALHKGNAEVELAALDGGLLDLAKAGLHARVSGGDDVERADSQHQNDNHCEQRKNFLHKTLFDIMEWEEGLKYRFRGQFVEQGDNKLMLFELDEPEMIKIEEIVLPPKEEEAEGKTVKQTIYIFPPEWAGTFGQPITSIAQVGILQQEHYAGNWDVLRPAAEIKEMNTFTADGLNALLHEAEEIMEGWTDTNE